MEKQKSHRIICSCKRVTVDARVFAGWLIVIMKDVASIAACQSKILGRDPIWIMKRILKICNKIIKFSKRSKLPILFVSYEKILSNPLGFIRAIQSFTGICPGERQIASALEFIDPDSEAYKQFCASKYRQINKDLRGCVDVVQPEQIAGWAMDGNTGKPVEVILNVNGVDVERTIANLARDNVNKKEFSIKGECSFEFNNLSKDLVKDGSIVRVFISNPRVEYLVPLKLLGN